MTLLTTLALRAAWRDGPARFAALPRLRSGLGRRTRPPQTVLEATLAVCDLTDPHDRVAALWRLAGEPDPHEAAETLDALAAYVRGRTAAQGGPPEDAAPAEADIQLAVYLLADRRAHGADLAGAHLAGVDLVGGHLHGADLRDADLRRARLAGADLTRADLRRARLGGVDAGGVRLVRAVLHGARLDGADLRDASLASAELPTAVLDGACLVGADLTGADLAGASLRGADLRGARMHYADLTGADLTGVLRDEQPASRRVVDLRDPAGLPLTG